MFLQNEVGDKIENLNFIKNFVLNRGFYFRFRLELRHGKKPSIKRVVDNHPGLSLVKV